MENRTYADAFNILGSLTDIKIDFASAQPQIDLVVTQDIKHIQSLRPMK